MVLTIKSPVILATFLVALFATSAFSAPVSCGSGQDCSPLSSGGACVDGQYQCSPDGLSLMQCAHNQWVSFKCGPQTRCMVFDQPPVYDAECVAIVEYDGLIKSLTAQAKAAQLLMSGEPLASEAPCEEHHEKEPCPMEESYEEPCPMEASEDEMPEEPLEAAPEEEMPEEEAPEEEAPEEEMTIVEEEECDPSLDCEEHCHDHEECDPSC